MNDDPTPELRVQELDAGVPHILYQRYDGQDAPQACHVALDLREATLTAGYNPEVGDARPGDVYHGFVRWYEIPCLTAADANVLLHSLTPLAQRIVVDFAVRWRGHDEAVLGPDAEAAEQELEALIATEAPDLDHVFEIDAGEWFSEGELPELTAATTDDEIKAIADTQQREAATMQPGYTVLDAHPYLTARREELRKKVRDNLTAIVEDIEKATNRRNELIVLLGNAGDHNRAIAPHAGMSHAGVGKVQRRMARRTLTREQRAAAREQKMPAADARVELEAVVEAIKNQTETRDTLIVQVATFGDSNRAIGALVGMSHLGVRKVRERMAEAALARKADSDN